MSQSPPPNCYTGIREQISGKARCGPSAAPFLWPEMGCGGMAKCRGFNNFKERGEWVELQFMARALRKRFRVSKPWGRLLRLRCRRRIRPHLPARTGQIHRLQNRQRLSLCLQAQSEEQSPLHHPQNRLLRRLRNPGRRLVPPPSRRRPPDPQPQLDAVPGQTHPQRCLPLRSLPRSLEAPA